ncbi:F0F1 ATP synthase subunit delta [uncultured Tessaracoccus sp.]|uniref:F0F1 ATP synthase subunit delta n=1 Tax=uncultured Tessaracoccus sp. TaxID=905023 RepID=UPI0025F47A9D|nr:F0F1 ATP synthase subunit delta [uncultured Tessaracoccus sp.]
MIGHDAAHDLFALTDVLAGQPRLRRALSDPSASPEQRLGLARRLFGERVGEEALATLERTIGGTWRSPERFVRGIELAGVEAALCRALANGTLDEVVAQLHALAKAVAGSPELTAALRNPAFTAEAKRGLVVRLLGDDVSPVTTQLAARAVDGHRRTFAKTIDDYLELAASVADSAVARVTVARPLDEGRLDRLRAALSARTGRRVTLQVDVDPSVLGGIHVALGDEVYESTVAGRLDEVRRQLINS